MCIVLLYNLIYIYEDVIIMLVFDNYWCVVFEWVVKGYIKRLSNCKGIEFIFVIVEV